ncbi:hypothetical protein [Aquimarina sp. I32.4]|uniref:hypothetical protein n=1 Tax=Aquimarina sp. I32.4 TaxID=2053903 RepID=UPI000CDEAC61|nr:hypothetical protein [Aquimarina sp. I32.4]
MFGPVATTDCFLIDSYTINDNQHTRKVFKFYGRLIAERNDSVYRISSTNDMYKIEIEKYRISKEQADSICYEINKKYNNTGYGVDYGLEIIKNKSYYLKGIFNENGEIEIVKINTETGEFTKGLKNYPYKNE